MRATTLLNRAFNFTGTRVTDVDFTGQGPVTVSVKLRARKKLSCPHCSYTTTAGYDTRWAETRWRHLDLAGRKVIVKMLRRRLVCPTHGVVSQSVPFARPYTMFTRDFEDLTAWLAQHTDKSNAAKFLGIAWRTVGAIITRVVDDQLDDTRFDGLVNIGVDEISWKKHHNYLTLVSDHDTSKIVYGAPGKNAAAFDTFFAQLGPDRTGQVEAISMDMGAAFIKSAKANAPHAALCVDAFHVVQLGTRALEEVRKDLWRKAKSDQDPAFRKKYKGVRWAVLKNPEDLTSKQQAVYEQLKAEGGQLWEAYLLKESLRQVFAGDLSKEEVVQLLDQWCQSAGASGLAPFEKAAETIVKQRVGIVEGVVRKLSNGRHEGLNNKVRMLMRRSYGFHSPEATLAMVMLVCGPVQVDLPYHR